MRRPSGVLLFSRVPSFAALDELLGFNHWVKAKAKAEAKAKAKFEAGAGESRS
ncbi:hypothetical protein IEQ11_05990 [Lysobacter capsici]|uniref:hypothetical protein n=1 Tax=Lysobacter capsici TaxID=435897 RepID=UPI00177CB0FB|nr:hypothetical protein [Lysobacter capsici]UOF16199.1 hypothetical protein IEQ11_05990 [Lysobacter capsici]